MRFIFHSKRQKLLSKPVITAVFVCFVLLTLPSCVSRLIATQMVGAPNQSLVGYELSSQFSAFDQGHEGLLDIDGIEQRELYLASRNLKVSYIDIASAQYGFSFKTTPKINDKGRMWHVESQWQWFKPSCQYQKQIVKDAPVLILLHGWGRHKNSLLSYGVAFAQQGYRVIIPDLRGHGGSSGEWVSFGAEEGRDISALVDAIGIESYDLVGFSLGASTGFHVASQDPRLDKLVAVAPMHSLEQTIPKFSKRSSKWVGRLVSAYKDNALQLVNELAGYSYADTSDSIAPLRLIDKPILFIYGSNDHMSDQQLNQLLMKQGSEFNQIHRLEGLRHTHVLLHQTALMPPIIKWLGGESDSASSVKDVDCPLHHFQI